MDGERGVEYDSWDVRRSEDGTLTVAVQETDPGRCGLARNRLGKTPDR
jgi:hypothetical protein